MSEGAMRLLLYKAALSLQEQPCSDGAVFQRLMGHGNIYNQSRWIEKKQGGLCGPPGRRGHVMLHSTPMGKGVPGFFLSQ